MAMTFADGVAWVTEDGGEDALGPLSLARFSVCVEGPAMRGWCRPIDRGACRSTTRWSGRVRAQCVVVSYDAALGHPRHFIAGTTQPPRAVAPLPAWPPDDLDLFAIGRDVIHIFNLGDELQVLAALPPDVP